MSPLPGVVTGLFRDNEQLESLPPMARARLQEQENAAEVLTRVIQLGIVLFFSILYITSPKLGAPDKQFITPLILLLYVALTAFGLIWSIRKPLPDWAVYGSTIIDMALLYALIWTFHIIYEQPPSFYLKAPTLLYVFIFITLRALRFQARFVIASGVTAAVGWGLMFMYVLVFDKFNEMVTRDFVTYLTSNSILIGAEVDKIISILVVTAILALSISRARQTLIRAITEQHAASNLSRFFDEDVAGEITANDIDLDNESGVERSAAILNIDLRGFSKLAETHEPNEVIALLTAYQKRVVPIIKKHGGSIDKFLGDGILASFGALRACDTCCSDALRAMDEILADYRTWAEDPVLQQVSDNALGLALSYGEVVFGPIGDGNRLEFTVIGSTVNLSAKLEKHNKAIGSRAIISKPAYDAGLVQGYQPVTSPVEQTVHVEGLSGALDVLVHFPGPGERQT